ncbi:MAG: fibronectin type III domain-containing protein [Methanomassiliicoccales archaeon]
MDSDEAKRKYNRAVLISTVVIVVALLVGVSLAINGAFTPRSDPAKAPDPPLFVAATPGDSQVRVNWTAPASDGGSTITGYNVFFGLTNATDTQFGSVVGPDVHSVNVTGLVGSGPYYFAVEAVNAVGGSAKSNTAVVSPWGPPDPPHLESAIAGSSEVNLTWSAPLLSNGTAPITYNVYFGVNSPPSTLYAIVGQGVLGIHITGLDPAIQYYFAVSTNTSLGEGPLSNLRGAIPFTTPSEPRVAEIWYNYGNVTFNWAAPLSDGGSPLLGYKVCVNPLSEPIEWGLLLPPTTLETTVYFNQMRDVWYRQLVVAVNAAGEGDVFDAGSFRNSRSLDVPEITRFSADPGVISLEWTLVISSGGTAATGYALYYGLDSAPTSVYAIYPDWVQGAQVTDLAPGAYSFGVRAIFDTVYSNLSNIYFATFIALPGPPTSPLATPGLEMVTLTWDAPASEGSSPISGYRIYWGLEETQMFLGLDVNASQLAAVVNGLIPGHRYYFAVGAMTIDGIGPTAGAVSAVPYTLAEPPYLYSAAPGIETVILDWGSSQYDGGLPLLGYQVYYGRAEDSYVQFGAMLDPSVRRITVTGLTPQVQYYFSLTSITAAGESLFSSPLVATPNSAPAAPSITNVAISVNGVLVTWAAPVDEYVHPVVSYTLYYGTTSPPAGIFGTFYNPSTVEVTGLTIGVTYYFGFTATTFDGQYHESAMSNIEAVLMEAVPSPPTLDSAVPGEGMVTLAWTAPVYEGSPVLGYTVVYGTAAPGQFGRTVETTSTSVAVTGLTAGLGYHFYVKAFNRAGESAMSNYLVASPLGAAMLSEVALAQADLPVGWEVSSPFSYGYQGSFVGNVTDSGGASYAHNGTVQESAVIGFWRYSDQADADYVYTLLLNMLTAQGLPFTDLAVGDKAVIIDRDIGMGPGKEIIILNGNDIIFILYGVASGTVLEGSAIALAELQVAKSAALA